MSTLFSHSIIAFCAAAGIFIVAYLPRLPSIWLLLFFCLLALFLFYRRYIAFAVFLLGVVYGSVYGHWLVGQQWPIEFNNQRFIVQGTIVNLPEKLTKPIGDAYRFHLHIEDIAPVNNADASLNLNNLKHKKIALSWQPPRGAVSDPVPRLKTGDLWQLEVKLRRPRGFVNPAGFDYQLYLLQQKLMATGYVRKSRHNQWQGNTCRFYKINCVRQAIAETIRQQSASFQYSGLLLGLLIGDRQNIKDEQWDLLKNTGTVHLLAISGLHVGLAAGLGLLFGRFVMRCWQLACRCLPVFSINSGVYLPSLFSLLFAGTYSALAGLSLPTQRALIMVVVFYLFVLGYRKVSPWLLLAVALFFIALLGPLSIRSQGFWLSFLAVALLLWVFSGYVVPKKEQGFLLIHVKQFCCSLTKAQWVITIGLFLPGILLVQGVSVSSPLANIVAIPLVSVVTVPLLLGALIGLPFVEAVSYFLLILADNSLAWLLSYLHFLENHIGRFWYFSLGEIQTVSIVLAALGLLWLLLPKGIPHRWLGCLCFLPIFLPVQFSPPLHITFLEVGQGTAIVVKTPHHQLVYDTGKRYSQRFDSGEHIIAPYLLKSGHQGIDILITSHGDSDHSGGAAGLASLIDIGQHLSGEPSRTGGEQCLAGQQWQWDQVHFSVLWPTKAYLEQAGRYTKSNNLSCVVLLRQGSYRILLAGDIEKSVEQQLLALYPDELSSLTAILVPHHGSRTSSHRYWVDHLQPKYAIVTAGYTNAYGHPHPKVLARYQAVNSVVEHTGNSGAIDLVINADGDWLVRRWREWKKRYWYD